MRRVCTVFRSLHVMLATACVAAAALPALADGGKAREARAGEASRRLPLAFEANKGQADSRVKFLARGARNTLFLTEREAVLSLAGREGSPAESLRMTFPAGNANARINGVDQLPGKTNYLIGKDPAAWHTGISSYGAVRYERIYRGVDLVFHGSDERQLEYDFIVDPGADPRVIRLRFEGASRLSIDSAGNLVISMAGGDLIERAPVAYQDIDGARRPVAARYELHGTNEIGFRVARYDRRQPLTIDPVLIYSTFLGGSSGDQAFAVAVDASGSAYVTGSTSSLDFPATNRFWPTQPSPTNNCDLIVVLNMVTSGCAFVTKFSPAGNSVIYSTVFGPGGAFDIAVDAAGSAYVTGDTCSPDFPTVNPFQASLSGPLPNCDAFVTKLSPAGDALVYSTFLGGSCGDAGFGIAVDATGNAYVAGQTGSVIPINEPCAAANFPVVNGFQSTHGGIMDAFVAKLDPTGSRLLYSTYLGGRGDDGASGIALDGAGNVYVGGTTSSANFPTVHPFQACGMGGEDGFVAKVSPGGDALAYSTCLGGGCLDQIHAIATDSSGHAYATGETCSSDYPTLNAFQNVLRAPSRDGFVTKLSLAGDSLVYSTFLGGSALDTPYGIAVDPSGNAYITGQTFSADFPTVNPIQPTLADSRADAFIARVSADGNALTYSTYIGGTGNPTQQVHDWGWGVAVDSTGNAYVAGFTPSADFPTLNAFQPTFGGGSSSALDGFLFKLASAVPAPAAPVANAGADQSVAEGTQVTLDGSISFDANADPLTYQWVQIAGPPVTLSAATAMRPVFTAPAVSTGGATLTFQLTVNDGHASGAPDTVNITITNVNHAPVADAGADQTVRAGGAVTLDATGSFDQDGDSLHYLWFQTAGAAVTLSDATVSRPTFTAPAAGETLTFVLFVNDGIVSPDPDVTFESADDVRIVVSAANQIPIASAGSDQTVDEGATVTLNATASADADGDRLTYSWIQVSGPAVPLVNGDGPQPHFTAPAVGATGATLVFQLVVGDGSAASQPDTVTITVRDANQPPSCGLATASSSLVWPPNHKLVSVAVQGVSDPDDRDVRITITGVTQDEPLNGLGDGDTTPDAVLQAGSVLLRAERSGLGTGRIYTVTFSATDIKGAACTGTIAVCVPHDRGTDACIDTGLRYNSLGR